MVEKCNRKIQRQKDGGEKRRIMEQKNEAENNVRGTARVRERRRTRKREGD